jgi:hypothetical protein
MGLQGLLQGTFTLIPAKYYLGDQIEKKEMGQSGSTYEERRVHTGFYWGDLWEEDHLKDPGIDGGIIFKWIVK